MKVWRGRPSRSTTNSVRFGMAPAAGQAQGGAGGHQQAGAIRTVSGCPEPCWGRRSRGGCGGGGRVKARRRPSRKGAVSLGVATRGGDRGEAAAVEGEGRRRRHSPLGHLETPALIGPERTHCLERAERMVTGANWFSTTHRKRRRMQLVRAFIIIRHRSVSIMAWQVVLSWGAPNSATGVFPYRAAEGLIASRMSV